MSRNQILILALGVFCLGVGLSYAFTSPGTYQDDDVDRYYMAREVWKQPGLILDPWGMPLALAAFAIPSRLAGYAGLETSTVVMTTTAAVLTGMAARFLGLSFPWLAVLFLFFQPMVLQLSYSALGEPVAATLLALVLFQWYRGRVEPAVMIAGLLPLARIDAGVLSLVVLAAGWTRSRWRVRLGFAAPGFLWALGAFILTGEPLHVIGVGADRPLNSLGPLFYLQNAVITLGAPVFFFLVWSLVRRVGMGKRAETSVRFPDLALALVLVHWVTLSLLAWEAIPFGRSVGFLRHAVSSAPALALLSVWGAGDWIATRPRRVPRLVFGLLATGMVAVFASHTLLGEARVGDGRVEYRWMIAGGIALLGLGLLGNAARTRRLLAAGVGLGVCALALLTVRPIGLDSERAAIDTAITQMEPLGIRGAVVHTNHPWFVFLTGRDRYDKVRTPPLTQESIETLQPGAFLIWENHYGHRLWGDVPIAQLREDPRLERVLELAAGARRNFQVVAFRVIR